MRIGWVLVLAGLLACDRGVTEPAVGEEGGVCSSEGECFGDLVCEGGRCVVSAEEVDPCADIMCGPPPENGSITCVDGNCESACDAFFMMDGEVCVDVDECLSANGGCGDATYYSCTNQIGAAPTCADIDECAINNGGCGDAAWNCINRVGEAPECEKVCPLGEVTNAVDPQAPGAGLSSVWIYGEEIGISAGEAMCQLRGFDQVCTYAQLLSAEEVGEFDTVTDGTYWLHRVSLTVTMGSDGGWDPNGVSSAPGPGGRCNDWTYPTGHIADGEYVEFSNGVPVYHFDKDTRYTGMASDGHAGSGPDDGGPCGGAMRGILCCAAHCGVD